MTEKKEYATISFGTEPDVEVFAKEMCDGYVYIRELYAKDRNDPESKARPAYVISVRDKDAECTASLLLSGKEMMRLRTQIMRLQPMCDDDEEEEKEMICGDKMAEKPGREEI